MEPSIKRFLQSWIINTLAVLVAVAVLPGLSFKDDNLWTPFLTSLVLGILNAIIRPILMYMALPLLIVTLGLFTLVINALLLYLVGLILGGHFEVDGFLSAFLGAIIISFVSLVLNLLIGTNKATIQVRRRGPPRDRGPGGDGPVIDV
jgi:putative membrane protein